VAVRPIRLFGDPVLRRRADEVVDFDRELRTLVTDLTDTMVDAEGSGIAAPQVGVGLRVFTWVVDGEFGHIVNPTVELVGDEESFEREGCLSIPGLPFDCRRHLRLSPPGSRPTGAAAGRGHRQAVGGGAARDRPPWTASSSSTASTPRPGRWPRRRSARRSGAAGWCRRSG
jgi:hypothetical protein